ncbi:MAG: crossover junction endodeoxyribonuclease RuvC, partial [Bdellovibrionales bacterium]|nr:crossover junction endodeoxyribonuclease RuvC [Bdellovibrionales bacterium]
MSVILGIDPGSIKTGWGIIENHRGKLRCAGFGVIYLQEKNGFAGRLGQLGSELQKIIVQYKPAMMSVEKIFLGKNADSAFKLGHARGVALGLAGQNNLAVGEYATRHVKKMLTGTG